MSPTHVMVLRKALEPLLDPPRKVSQYLDDLPRKVSQYLDLSGYEARVYVALAREGLSEARKLSMKCGVPRTKIYATLKKLTQRGIVSEIPSEPRKFVLISPTKAFEGSLLEFRKRASDSVVSVVESTKVVSLLEEAFEKTQQTPKRRKEEMWIIQGRSEVQKKLREMLSHAKKSVLVITKDDGFIWFCKVFDKLLDKLVENGVDVQMRTPVNFRNGHLARELNYTCNVKHLAVPPPLFCLCVDDNALLLGMLSLGDIDDERDNSVGASCDSPTLCNLLSSLLPQYPKKNRQVVYAT